jgi:MFS family permease
MTINHSISYKVALGGIISALCLFAMFLSGVIPMLYIALPMIAGILMMIMVIEINWQWAFVTYIASGLLSLFITFDKEAAIIFIVLFGYYPIIKHLAERIKIKIVSFLIKFVVFNAGTILYFLITVYVLGSKELIEEVTRYGKYSLVFIFSIIELLFFGYETTLKVFSNVYLRAIKPKISK